MLNFFKNLFKAGLIVMLKFVIAFSVGTGAGAVVCWYYSIPLGFSILGGILVLALALALMSDSTFD